jgi:membrane-associated protein
VAVHGTPDHGDVSNGIDLPARRSGSGRGVHAVVWLAVVVAVIAAVILLWNEGQQLLDGEVSGAQSYVIAAALVFGDAIIPVLPGETTLNAACVLAANGQLELRLVMLSGAIGAVGGDSALYWIARSAHGKTRRRLDRAVDGKTGRSVIHMLSVHGPAFIVFGRYVPGLRFAINVTLGGVVRMPYRRFLLWSALSGVLWSVVTCLGAYFISSALEGYPVVALVLSTCLGTALIASCVWIRSRFSKPAAAATGG